MVRDLARIRKEKRAMGYKAIYTYAWDLADAGVSAATGQFRSLGLDTVTIAGSYHAGKFLRPHGKTGKVFFPERRDRLFPRRPFPIWRHQTRRKCAAEGPRRSARALR
jgi:hypothetical protein